jgi:aminoglycoside phosphotransferase (APT) family kinase protein
VSDEIPVHDVLAAIGFDRPASVRIVRGGADALLWRVSTDEGDYALRLLRSDQRDQAAHEVKLTHWVNSHDPDLAVPRVICSGIWNDRPACLMTWVEGRTLGEALLSTDSDRDKIEYGRQFGEAQARIHALPVPPGLGQFSPRWIERLGSADLSRRVGEITSDRFALLHLDYHPLNVMVNDGALAAVLDWANAAVGDPQFDLARTRAIIELAPLPTGSDPASLQDFLGAWRSGYEATAGPFEIDPVASWWAGALIEHELTPRVGNPGLPWLTDAHILRVREWTDQYRR